MGLHAPQKKGSRPQTYRSHSFLAKFQGGPIAHIWLSITTLLMALLFRAFGEPRAAVRGIQQRKQEKVSYHLENRAIQWLIALGMKMHRAEEIEQD